MTALQRPPALRSGDVIAIIPTARAIVLDEIRDGIVLAESWGLRVRIGEGIGRKDFQQAGTPEQRAQDLQAAINDPSVRAIWCARGGYGTMQLMPHLDLSVLKKDPKWIIGFSDITVLHNHLQNIGLCSLHAQMAHMVAAKTEETRETLRAALFGEAYSVEAASREPRAASLDAANKLGTPGSKLEARAGTCEGVLVGGNLSLLYGLRGTPYDIDPKGKILFMEDLDELLYHVDRMVMNLKLSGWFQNLAGLVVGGMNDMHDKNPADPFGRTAEQIIADATRGTNYPVAFGFPVGHIKDNRALIMGEKAKLSVTANGATLSFGASLSA
jgi:muramoyltetrapeptide carboxypeptidase